MIGKPPPPLGADRLSSRSHWRLMLHPAFRSKWALLAGYPRRPLPGCLRPLCSATNVLPAERRLSRAKRVGQRETLTLADICADLCAIGDSELPLLRINIDNNECKLGHKSERRKGGEEGQSEEEEEKCFGRVPLLVGKLSCSNTA